MLISEYGISIIVTVTERKELLQSQAVVLISETA